MRVAEMTLLADADAILRDVAAIRHTRALEVIALVKGLSIMGSKTGAWMLPLGAATVRN